MSYIGKNSLNLLVTGFGCCRQEIYAVDGPIYDIQRFGINFVNLPEDADVLVVQGFFNKIGIERAVALYERMSCPKWVVAVGKCALSGNLFSAESKLLEEFKEKVNINVYVPGCPPRPEAFLYSILRLMDRI